MRYQALLTTRQLEILTFLDDTIHTVGSLTSSFNELADPSDPQVWPKVTRESVYQSLRWLEARGLVMRNPGTWSYNQEWTATEAGQRAADAAEAHPELRPTRRVAA